MINYGFYGEKMNLNDAGWMSINIFKINTGRNVFVNVIYICYYLFQAFKICHNFFYCVYVFVGDLT
jgi:hypothetical protein